MGAESQVSGGALGGEDIFDRHDGRRVDYVDHHCSGISHSRHRSLIFPSRFDVWDI